MKQDHQELTKLVSRLENGAALPGKLYAKTGRAHIVGITGPPGVGKSSLIDRMIEEYRRQKKSVGVIAVDPTSPITGGALLSDRLRMQRQGEHDAVAGLVERVLAAKRAEPPARGASADEPVRATPFVGLVVVIDKASHLGQYTDPVNPYHFCLVALLQRYCFWLGSRRGDVMGESRGRVEDQQLKAAYEALYAGGDWHNNADFYQARLTSKEIKLPPKHKNIAGLQLADLLAHPGKQRCLLNHSVAGIMESPFGKQVADLYWQKLRKRWNGTTKGWGEIFIG